MGGQALVGTKDFATSQIATSIGNIMSFHDEEAFRQIYGESELLCHQMAKCECKAVLLTWYPAKHEPILLNDVETKQGPYTLFNR